MKKILSKLPAMVAMLIGLPGFILYVQYLLQSESDIWIGSVIFALLSLPFFFIDAIISFVKAIKKNDAKFNGILALVLVGAIPMIFQFGSSGNDAFNVVWNIYYLLMYVLEVISIKKTFHAMKAN